MCIRKLRPPAPYIPPHCHCQATTSSCVVVRFIEACKPPPQDSTPTPGCSRADEDLVAPKICQNSQSQNARMTLSSRKDASCSMGHECPNPSPASPLYQNGNCEDQVCTLPPLATSAPILQCFRTPQEPLSLPRESLYSEHDSSNRAPPLPPSSCKKHTRALQGSSNHLLECNRRYPLPQSPSDFSIRATHIAGDTRGC